MTNSDFKPLKINPPFFTIEGKVLNEATIGYTTALSNLAIAESNLLIAGRGSSLPHFLAIVKELERIYGFTFEIAEDV